MLPHTRKISQVSNNNWRQFAISQYPCVLGTIHVQHVGLNYYNNFQDIFLSGTQLRVVREPENYYDKNALRVEILKPGTKHWRKCGYIRKTQAAKLAPLIDSKKIVKIDVQLAADADLVRNVVSGGLTTKLLLTLYVNPNYKDELKSIFRNMFIETVPRKRKYEFQSASSKKHKM